MLNFFLDVVDDSSFIDPYRRLILVIAAILAIGGLVWFFIWKKRRAKRTNNQTNNPTTKP